MPTPTPPARRRRCSDRPWGLCWQDSTRWPRERTGEACHVSSDISIYLEREREEVSSDLSEAVDADVVVASIVQVLDITHFCVGVVGDNLTSVPT